MISAPCLPTALSPLFWTAAPIGGTVRRCSVRRFPVYGISGQRNPTRKRAKSSVRTQRRKHALRSIRCTPRCGMKTARSICPRRQAAAPGSRGKTTARKKKRCHARPSILCANPAARSTLSSSTWRARNGRRSPGQRIPWRPIGRLWQYRCIIVRRICGHCH